MANIPSTSQENPYSASPDDIDVDVESQFSPEEIDDIKTNLAPMDTEALNAYFEEQGIQGEEADTVRSLIQQIKEKDQAQAQSVSAQSAQMPASTPGPVGPGLEQPELPEGLTPERYLEAIKSARAASPILGLASDIALGESALLPYHIPAVVGSILFPAGRVARATIAGAGGLAAGIFGEQTENSVREKLGLESTEYNWIQNILNGVGVGAAVRGVKSLPAAYSKEAAEGALGIKKSVGALADKMADGLKLTEKEKALYVENVNRLMETNLKYYENFKGFSPEMRAQKAFQDTAKQLRITDSIKEMVDLVPDLSFEEFSKMVGEGKTPGKELFEFYQARSKARQFSAAEELGGEVEKTIELAKKKKASIEGLFVPLAEFRDGIGKIFRESEFLMPKMKDGSQVIFDNGQFFFKTKQGLVKPIVSGSDDYNRVMTGVKSNPYLSAIYDAWKQVDSRYSEVLSTSGKEAVAQQKSYLTISQLSQLRKELDLAVGPASTGAVSAAKDKVVGMLRQMEDSQVQKLIDNGNPALAQAAQNYQTAKKLSFASAQVFDPLVELLGAESGTVASAFEKLTVEQIKKFVAASKQGIPSLKGFQSPIVTENIVQYVGRRMMEQRFNDLLVMAGEGAEMSASNFAKFPEVVKKMGADPDFRVKMEVLLGKKEFNSALQKLQSNVKEAENIVVKMEAAAKAGNVKAENALKAAGGELATRMALGAVGGPTVYTLPFLKRIFDSSGLVSAQKAVNRVVFTKGLDDFVQSLRTVEDGVVARRQIIEAFGDNPLGAQVLADFDNKARIYFLSKKALAVSGAAKVGSMAARAGQEAPAREQPGQY